jgi:phenylacetate-CoA ligase
MHAGLERVGVTVVPTSTGNTQRQLKVMRDFKTTVLVGTPSYALHLTEVAPESGYDLKSLDLRVALLGSEPWTNQTREVIEQRTGMSASDIYGLSEVIGPGVSFECWNKDGLHINEDHFLVEVVDPATGEPVPEGTEGELVFTSLTKEALPMVRYRTRDLTRLLPPTARSMRRMEKITGRSDDMLIIRGVNVFPTQVEELILSESALEPHYQIEVTRPGHLDEMVVLVERSPSAGGADGQTAGARLAHLIKSMIGVSAQVRVVAPGSIERSLGKAKRVVDKRPKG